MGRDRNGYAPRAVPASAARRLLLLIGRQLLMLCLLCSSGRASAWPSAAAAEVAGVSGAGRPVDLLDVRARCVCGRRWPKCRPEELPIRNLVSLPDGLGTLARWSAMVTGYT